MPNPRAFAVTLFASLFLVGCGTSQRLSAEDASAGTPPVKRMPMQREAPPPLSDEQKAQLAAGEAPHEPAHLTFDVNGGSFFFAPNVIHAKKGDAVKVIFHNLGGMHNFVLDEFNVRLDPIQGGENATVEFTADKSGTFEYYCSVGSHRSMGQTGKLIVT